MVYFLASNIWFCVLTSAFKLIYTRLTTGLFLLLIAQVQQWAAAPRSTTSTILPRPHLPRPTTVLPCPPTRPSPTPTAAWRPPASPPLVPLLLRPPAPWAAADDYHLHPLQVRALVWVLFLNWAPPTGHTQRTTSPTLAPGPTLLFCPLSVLISSRVAR